MNADAQWHSLLMNLRLRGREVAPASAGGDFKGHTTRELLAYQTTWPMASPVILNPARKLGYRFMAAEAAWVLSGDNRLETIRPFSRRIHRFSDDGRTFDGAYGPPFVDQAAHVARTLHADRASRQAVMTIWRPRPGPSKDTPCTVALQWLIRPDDTLWGDGGGRLHCVATMRSSDAWTGIPYDIFTFSMMSAYVLLALRGLDEKLHGKSEEPYLLTLGLLYLTAGSAHLYKRDWAEAELCEKDFMSRGNGLLPGKVEAVELDEFGSPDDLIRHLWIVARKQGEEFDAAPASFLRELMVPA